MSNARNLLVSVPVVCSRTDKEHAVKIPVDEAPAFLASLEAKTQAAEVVANGISTLPVKPDVVVYYKGHVIVLANVHEKSDNAIMRCVNEIANKKIFVLPEPKKRTKTEEPDAPATDSDEPAVEVEAD